MNNLAYDSKTYTVVFSDSNKQKAKAELRNFNTLKDMQQMPFSAIYTKQSCEEKKFNKIRLLLT